MENHIQAAQACNTDGAKKSPLPAGPWEARPVPGLNCICIAQAGMMHSHAHVTTATDSPEPLTETEYAIAALIKEAPNLLDELKAAAARIELANSEGDPILSAWLPGAKAIIARAEKLT